MGNRIVAGGEYFTKSAVIDDEAREKLTLCEELAPLHNPPADACIDMMREHMPNTPQVAVFDTAFHSTMPPKAYLYPLPREYYEKYRIRRYGAHRHEPSLRRPAGSEPARSRPLRDLGIITCHLGNGGSITAVNHGKSIDTTMGFTPLEGLMMGTRSGSIDPAIVTYLMRREHKTFDEMDRILNKESGILGRVRPVRRHARRAAGSRRRRRVGRACHRDVRAPRAEGHRRVLRHHDAHGRGGHDGGASARIPPRLRERIFAGLAHMGMILDKDRNNVTGEIGLNRVISIDDSPIKICIVTADEEIRIARETDNPGEPTGVTRVGGAPSRQDCEKAAHERGRKAKISASHSA